MALYAAMRDNALTYINEGTDIDAVLASGCEVWRVEDDESHEVVYTPDGGWLTERPTDDELRGIRRYTSTKTMTAAEVARIIQLSLTDPDAAMAELSAATPEA